MSYSRGTLFEPTVHRTISQVVEKVSYSSYWNNEAYEKQYKNIKQYNRLKSVLNSVVTVSPLLAITCAARPVILFLRFSSLRVIDIHLRSF